VWRFGNGFRFGLASAEAAAAVVHGDLFRFGLEETREAADGWVHHEGKRFEQTRFWGGVWGSEIDHESWARHVYLAYELAEAARARDL